MENLVIDLDIESCEAIFRDVEEGFDAMYGVYTGVLSATGDYAQAWSGDNVTRFLVKMEYFRTRLEEEAAHMDAAICKMRGCMQKAKELEEISF